MRLHLDAQNVRPAEGASPGVAGPHGASTRPAIAGHDTPADKDTVAISAASSAITSLSAQHSSKIARLAEAVRGGSYSVSSDSLSSAIVSRSTR